MSGATKPLTGGKVLAMFVGAFAIIIGANLALVFSALGTFPGLEVENTYVTSQKFDAERAGQQKLGWNAATSFDGTALRLEIKGPDGLPANIASLEATVGRATIDSADKRLDFQQDHRPYLANISLTDGKWEVRILATAPDGTLFRQRLPIWVD